MQGGLREQAPDDLTLIETLLWPVSLPRLALHQARLRRGCAALGVAVPDLAAVLARLPEGPLRVRVTVDLRGRVERVVAPFARGAYCGAIGWVAPTGAMEFSVAIRTALLREGRITLNVGGGIVADSQVDAEWEEALCKAGFASRHRTS